MATKFFNNEPQHSLFDKLSGIARDMKDFHSFLAVAGYFRSSGYFKLRRELGDVPEIRILIGINADDIMRGHDRQLAFFSGDAQKAKEMYTEEFIADVRDANYSQEIEEGILQMARDLKDGRLKLRVHPSRNLHAKFYLCLPTRHTPNSDGTVIMGSSNLTDSGLGTSPAPNYELNVALRDYDDVHFCHQEFEKLWEEGEPLSLQDIEKAKLKTYLGYQPTPYEVYLKVLIEAFGLQVEDEFTMNLPTGVMDLKYQKDAVIQGYQMLLQHNGLFLADVVGLGKTLVAAMIAKRFIESNGRNTKILVVFPPALKRNWLSEMKRFGITRNTDFVTNGSLQHVIEDGDKYHDIGEYDLIIVDEAHQYRSGVTDRYDALQKICKAERTNPGNLPSKAKKVMLLSATPLNNRPEDLLNQLALFQDLNQATIPGIISIKNYFAPYIREYKDLMGDRRNPNANHKQIQARIDALYTDLRTHILDKVTIRRTRTNILNDPDYSADLKRQNIVFPKILPPREEIYQMDDALRSTFYTTMDLLSNTASPLALNYARYRAIEFLLPQFQPKHAEQTAKTLANLYRVHMVKRLESSFYAFRRSLETLLRITEDMIRMYNENKVIIAPEMDVKGMLAKGMDLDEIIDKAMEKGLKESDVVYKRDQFQPIFIELLKKDLVILQELNRRWNEVKTDPKLELFSSHLEKYLSSDINPTGRLVIFSESVDTVNYIYGHLTQNLKRKDVLFVTAENRDKLQDTITANFDANLPLLDQKDDYKILITSDVLAEGVNLHRANVIVNYDSPWNATRLMQRIGRVNRIGSVAPEIHNIVYYPSQEGDDKISLYTSALMKLQSFHSAYGEDSQIYSREEVLKLFQMYDPNVRDDVDKKIQLLRELREIFQNNRALYDKVKALPLKSRTMRTARTDEEKKNSVVYVSTPFKSEFYQVRGDETKPLTLLEAADILRADPEEKAADVTTPDCHYAHVEQALKTFSEPTVQNATPTGATPQNANRGDTNAKKALAFLRRLTQVKPNDEILRRNCDLLKSYVEVGKYTQLPIKLRQLAAPYRGVPSEIAADIDKLSLDIEQLVNKYNAAQTSSSTPEVTTTTPDIIISETFI